jgi:hypothetical protein
MPSRVLANACKIELIWAGPDGTTAVNVLHAVSNHDISDASIIDVIANTLGTACQSGSAVAAIKLPLSSLWALAAVRVTDISGLTGAQTTFPVNTVGTNSANCVPPSVGVVCRWPISAAYRGGHPRSTFPGLPLGGLDTSGGREVSALSAANWSLLAEAIQVAINAIVPAVGSILTQVIISWVKNKLPRVTPVAYAAGMPEIDQRLGSMRRRMGKGLGFY